MTKREASRDQKLAALREVIRNASPKQVRRLLADIRLTALDEMAE